MSQLLSRHRVPYLREVDRIFGDMVRCPKQTTTCYERERLGKLGPTDVKKLGKTPDGRGWHAHG